MITSLLSTQTLILFATIISLTLTSVLGFASDPNLPKPDTVENKMQTPRIISTIEELTQYMNTLHKELEAEKFDQVALLLRPMPTVKTPKPSADIIIRYMYLKAAAEARFEFYESTKTNIHTNNAVKKVEFGISLLDDFLQNLESRYQKECLLYPSFDKLVKCYKCSIYYFQYLGYTRWWTLLPSLTEIDGNKIEALQMELPLKLISCHEKRFQIRKEFPEFISEEMYLKEKLSLFDRYITLIMFDSSEKSQYLKKAKEICQELKNDTHDVAQVYYQQTLRYWDLLQKQQEMNSRQTQVKSKAIQNLKDQKIYNQLLAFTHAAQQLEGPEDAKWRTPNEEIRMMQLAMTTLAAENLNDPNIESQLKKIEQTIQSRLAQEGKPVTLFDVYKQYEIFLGSENFRLGMNSVILPTLLQLNNYTEALERVMILADLEHNNNGNVSAQTRYLRAAIKNLNGDHDEWQSLEQEMVEQHAKKKEKKKRDKEKRHKKNIEDIKQTQQRAEEEKQRQAQLQSERTAEKMKPSSTVESKSPKDEHALPSFSGNEDPAAKLKRHEEAEKWRQKNAASASSSNTSSITRTPPVATTTVSLSTLVVSQSIHNLYDLKGVAKTVDAEIENNTWQITREQLMSYFEALGCTAKNGGKHKKVTLPEAMLITHNGNIITILNDLGGALTLPRWDGVEGNGTVPHYLRDQILKARQKLALLKTKALDAIQ